MIFLLLADVPHCLTGSWSEADSRRIPQPKAKAEFAKLDFCEPSNKAQQDKTESQQLSQEVTCGVSKVLWRVCSVCSNVLWVISLWVSFITAVFQVQMR